MKKKHKYIIIGAIVMGFIIWLSIVMVQEAEQERQTNNIRQQQKELSLKKVVDDVNQIQVVDILYALERLTENYSLSEYSFDAVKDPDGQGFVAIIKNVPSSSGATTGEILFYVSKNALNQSKVSDLSKSIEAINGLAKEVAPSVSFSKKYNYSTATELFK